MLRLRIGARSPLGLLARWRRPAETPATTPAIEAVWDDTLLVVWNDGSILIWE